MNQASQPFQMQKRSTVTSVIQFGGGQCRTFGLPSSGSAFGFIALGPQEWVKSARQRKEKTMLKQAGKRVKKSNGG